MNPRLMRKQGGGEMTDFDEVMEEYHRTLATSCQSPLRRPRSSYGTPVNVAEDRRPPAQV
jgi:hypothetical protein